MKVLVPSEWSDVTVGEFQQLAALDADSTPRRRLADIISILCNIDSFQLDSETVKEIESNLSFLNKGLPKDRFSSFTHEGVEYEWIKSLNEITLGEEISIEQTIETEQLNYAQSTQILLENAY